MNNRSNSGCILYNIIAVHFVFPELDRSSEIRIIYVPSHLYHMLFELFKNSMRAVMEYHGSDSDNYPPLEVLLVCGKEDICVKVRRRERERKTERISIFTISIFKI